MASANGEEEYDTDPEEAKLSLALRRRVASDDEEEDEKEEEGERGADGGEKRRDGVPPRVDIRTSDEESDDQGAPEDYEDEDIEEDEEELEDGVELVAADDVRGRGRERASVDMENGVRGEGMELLEGEIADRLDVGDSENQVEGGEEKEHEPFAVPTAGAFYMHDDRFRENAAGRHRRTLGARKLWESKDERRWGHDKFEELTSQGSQFNEAQRNSKGHHRGRGRNRGTGRRFLRGGRSKMSEDNYNQAPFPGSVRGRGARRYDLTYKRRNEVPQTQIKQSGTYIEKSALPRSANGLASDSTIAHDVVPTKKNIVASNLNSASPPFYPSGSSSKDLNLGPKKDVQPANTSRNPRPSSMDENLANTMFRGSGGGGSLGLSKLCLDDTVKEPSNSSHLHPSRITNTPQGPLVRTQVRGQGHVGHLPSQSTSHPNHASKVSEVQLHAIQQGPPAQNRTQSYSQAPSQPAPKQMGSRSQVSSSPPVGHASLKSFESGEESQSESGKTKTAIVGKATSAVQGGPLGPFMYNGAHNMSVSHGDQNFPTFLPVMQFGAQHPGGIGVPAVGMAFPGYVQPQHGQGTSEMTWLPVLAGAAGALGATYCPPYMLDGAGYNPQLTGPQFAAMSSTNESNLNKAISERNPSQKPEHAGEDFDQRQNKPRRYSEMKFGQ
uniref:Btz domain-containing protein n=1 Tax=Kalanchoe fedtschenkoi TaxID=63787 RepID=A0A7N0UZS6_KALFE